MVFVRMITVPPDVINSILCGKNYQGDAAFRQAGSNMRPTDGFRKVPVKLDQVPRAVCTYNLSKESANSLSVTIIHGASVPATCRLKMPTKDA